MGRLISGYTITPHTLHYQFPFLLSADIFCKQGLQPVALWFGYFFVAMWAIAFFLATLLCCKVMLVAIWKPISDMAECAFFLHVLMAFCITGFATDVVIIGIPIPFASNPT